MIFLARVWSSQKSGAAAAASSCWSFRRLVSTSKITSHFCQSFAQLAETHDDFFVILYHVGFLNENKLKLNYSARPPLTLAAGGSTWNETSQDSPGL